MTNRWGNSGNSVRLFSEGGWRSKITVDGDCSHEIKRHLFLGRKVTTNLDSIFKSKDFDAGRDWGQEEKGTTEDEMAGWHHRHDGHEFE